MTLNLHLPAQHASFRPTITVIGVGGAGGNAVNNMINAKLEGVQFVVANTDAQALETALTERTIQLGANITQGLGAGASPEVGKAAAEEAMDEILAHMDGSHMLFVTAGMGGGTGTGAAPVIAKAARERGILTVAVVTKPFQFEGAKRMRTAEEGLQELHTYADTLIIIPNQNLFRIANEKTTFADAFRMADEVLHSGVRGVTDLMVKPGLVNLDFADIRTVMKEMGKAMMGTGEATGDKRATLAAEAAISNPLLDDVSLKGARAALINITGGLDMTLFEVDEAANRIREEIDPDANIIFGSTFNEAMDGQIRVSVVATGIDAESMQRAMEDRKVALVKKPFSAPAAANTGSTFIPRRETMSQPAAPKPAASPVPIAASSGMSTRTVSAKPNITANYVPAAPQRSEARPVERTQASAAVATAAAPMVQRAPEPHHYEEAEEEHYYETTEELIADNAVSPKDSGYQARETAAPQAEAPAEEHEPLFWKPREEKQEGGFSFLKKIAEVGQALSSKSEPVQEYQPETETEPEQQPVRNRRVEVSQSKKPEVLANTLEKEDYYDIPAFLRRQAN